MKKTPHHCLHRPWLLLGLFLTIFLAPASRGLAQSWGFGDPRPFRIGLSAESYLFNWEGDGNASFDGYGGSLSFMYSFHPNAALGADLRLGRIYNPDFQFHYTLPSAGLVARVSTGNLIAVVEPYAEIGGSVVSFRVIDFAFPGTEQRFDTILRGHALDARLGVNLAIAERMGVNFAYKHRWNYFRKQQETDAAGERNSEVDERGVLKSFSVGLYHRF